MIRKKSTRTYKIIKGMLCHVNLIPVNNVEEKRF